MKWLMPAVVGLLSLLLFRIGFITRNLYPFYFNEQSHFLSKQKFCKVFEGVILFPLTNEPSGGNLGYREFFPEKMDLFNSFSPLSVAYYTTHY